VGICNNQYFFSLAGVGFDAQVAYDFNRGKKRKFFGYFGAIFKDFFSYKNQYYEMELENEKKSGNFFFVTIANCSQWGYNVKVAPEAKLDDGVFSVCLCKQLSFFSIIPFGIKLLSGKIAHSKRITLINSKKITLTSNKDFFYHIDGDAKGVTRQIEIKLLPETLNIIVK
jgi:diacylglycerol kinase family enzyme